MNILVTGGTGTVGREVSRLLAEKGADFRILTRTPEKAGSRGVPGDFHDP
ncbi:MAG: NmrA family NAD(P)-binding protein, partial [Planctomycetia bacterium]|nr:NmrA family NAD(P)-binding protein [Planctomycetia bacterium]